MDDVRPEQQEGGLVCCCRAPGSPLHSCPTAYNRTLTLADLAGHQQADNSSFWRSPGCATNTDGWLVHQLLVRQVVYADKRSIQLGGPNPSVIRGLKQRDCSSSRLACDRGGHQHCSS